MTTTQVKLVLYFVSCKHCCKLSIYKKYLIEIYIATCLLYNLGKDHYSPFVPQLQS